VSETPMGPGAPMIAVKHLRKVYGDFEAVKDLSFEVYPGEVFGFLGPNGAGKTTTLRMITGLLEPSSGEVVIDGHNLQTSPVAAKSVVGFIPDRPYIYEKLTAVEFMQFVAGLYRLDRATTASRIEELLDLFDLVRWGGSLIENFSHGMKQRLVVATALLHRPKLLVVDEPMVGLDPRGTRLIKKIFRQICGDGGMTVFLSTHSLEVAEEVCDRIAIMHRGVMIRNGTLEELRGEMDQPGSRLEEIFLQITAEEDDPAEGSALGGMFGAGGGQ